VNSIFFYWGTSYKKELVNNIFYSFGTSYKQGLVHIICCSYWTSYKQRLVTSYKQGPVAIVSTCLERTSCE